MIGWKRTTACERAAQWISLDLDGELSPLETAALGRHLERCSRCESLSAELTGLTALLREAPLVPPDGDDFVLHASRPRARVARRVSVVVALAAGVAAVIALLSTSSPSGLLGPSQSALAFSNKHEQIAFVHNKYLQMEPLLNDAPKGAVAARAPAFSHRALR
jgi:anti-sigma factor RsiW